MVTNIAMTTRGVNVLFHSVSPVVSHPAFVHGGGPHLTDHGARRTEPSSIHGGRAVHGGAGRPTPTGPAGRGRPGRPRGSGSSGASRARSGSAGPVRRARPREAGAPALGPVIGIVLGENSRGTPSGESSLPTHSPMARTRVPPAPGSRFGDVTSAHIVRAQLTRIELRWILSSSAHIVRARMDSVEQAWKVILGSSEWCGWGSCGDPGWGRVQICHKGAPGRDRPRRKARNINDSLPVFRLDGGLCGRFGQLAPPRALWGGRLLASARSMTSTPARTPARRAVADRASAPFDRAGPARAPPGPRAGAPIREIAT